MISRAKPLLLLLLAQACVGINIVLSKGLVDHINPLIMMTTRFTFAALFMLPLCLQSGETKDWKFHLTKKDWLALLAKSLGAGLFFNLFMLTGLHFTNANSAGLITSLLPAIVVVLNILIFKQKLSKQMFIAIIISIAGLILINVESFGGSSANALLGNSLVFLSLLPEGLYYTLSKYYPISKIPAVTNAILLNALNLIFLYGVLAFMPLSVWRLITWHDGITMAFLGLTTGLFFLCWQRGVEQVDAGYASLATAFMPLSTVVLAWLILGETLTAIKFSGMLLVILSIVHYARHQRRNS
ncbi:MAG: DMT family transporter [Chthoniobacterales bacterium]|nr:DMT family transporter [Chthoniobacterales bacterium]